MSPHAIDVTTLLALFAVAALAACFDAIAGGGGLITVPLLLLAGLDPVAALATNKLQASCGTIAATFAYARRGLISGRAPWAFAAAGAFAAALGASVAEALPRAGLEALVPLALIAAALYFAFARGASESNRTARVSTTTFAATVCIAVGFYDGIFGPGTGAFCMIGFVTVMGCDMLAAAAKTRLVNAASNLGALAVFVVTARVVWPAGLTMAAGAVLGSQVGARVAIRHGARIIRPLIVVACCLMGARLAADPANPLRRMMSVLLEPLHR